MKASVRSRGVAVFRAAVLQQRCVSMVQAGDSVWHLHLPEAEVGEAACEQPAAWGRYGLWEQVQPLGTVLLLLVIHTSGEKA